MSFYADPARIEILALRCTPETPCKSCSIKKNGGIEVLMKFMSLLGMVRRDTHECCRFHALSVLLAILILAGMRRNSSSSNMANESHLPVFDEAPHFSP